VFHRSFRRPVKIRVETEPPLSADWITSPLPAGSFVRNLSRPPTLPVRRSRLMPLQPELQPDWRIVGDHELMLQEEGEVACH
jgi:hypothetical protein